MAPLLELRNADKHFGDQTILHEASVTLHEGHKVGFIGRNGVGKSTLAKIFMGEEELDAGEIVKNRDLRIGYLHQHDPFESGESVLDFLMRETGQPDWKCGEMVGRFRIKGEALHEPVTKLSGGWQSRVKLAGLLLTDPNFLILDEPTNFLDLNTQLLLERFLQAYKGACLVISHDRGFLNSVCQHTLELRRGKLSVYPGCVDEFLDYKREAVEHEQRVNAKVQAKQRQLQTFIDKNRAGANTASQARNKQKQLDRLELIDIESNESTVRMQLPVLEPRTGTAFSCDELSIGYGSRAVAKQIRLDLDHGQRVAVVGDNGQGKTTFLRTITDSLAPLAGGMKWGYGCEFGIYAQHIYGSLPPELTVQTYLNHCSSPGMTTQQIQNVAGSFLFRGSAFEKPITVLSGGERARLCLAGLFLKGHNVLILDEPVNHLDVETAGELAEALRAFPGLLIFTSHDRQFVEEVATQVVEVKDGRIRFWGGDYSSYLDDLKRRVDEPAEDSPATAKAAPTDQTVPSAPSTSGKAAYALQKEIAALERQLERAREPIVAIDSQLLEVTDWQAANELQQKKEALEVEVDRLENEWFELQERVEALD